MPFLTSYISPGVDPSLFSQSLMYFSSKHAATSWAGEPDYDPIEETAELGKSDVTLSPVEIIARAYQNVLDEPAVQCGEKALASAAFAFITIMLTAAHRLKHGVYREYRRPVRQAFGSQVKTLSSPFDSAV